MPFVSQAQRGLFYSKMKRGEMSPETVKHWEEATPKGKKLPEHVKKASVFLDAFEKTAIDKTKLYKGLEYGGLGALAATDTYDAYKAHKKGDTKERNKSLLNAGALGTLMAATHLAPH